MKKLLFFCIGALLWPICGAVVYAALLQFSRAGIPGRDGWLFLTGLGGYLLVHIFLYRPITMHVFGHELTHAIWTWIFGGRVTAFSVSKGGGNVVVTKSNFITQLAPYFFPVYGLIVLLVYGIIVLLLGHNRWFGVCAFMLGLSIAFHLAMTVYSLRVHQSDLDGPGYFFSLPFIIIMNVSIIMAVGALVYKPVSFIEYGKDTCITTGRLFTWLFSKVHS